MTLRRAVFITGIVVLCVWTLVPIYLIALAAVGLSHGAPLRATTL